MIKRKEREKRKNERKRERQRQTHFISWLSKIAPTITTLVLDVFLLFGSSCSCTLVHLQSSSTLALLLVCYYPRSSFVFSRVLRLFPCSSSCSLVLVLLFIFLFFHSSCSYILGNLQSSTLALLLVFYYPCSSFVFYRALRLIFFSSPAFPRVPLRVAVR